jgi:phenylpropionate dioxygenase-like ring-hydroxylating dioxygenase large terminal subunit
MERATEIELTKELIELHARKSAFLDKTVTQSPVASYFDPERFAREKDKILRTAPQPTVHSSELPKAGSFLRREFAGLPVLFTRDANGKAHAFLNVCRHRGTRLVNDHTGCKGRFSCPYHGWTWNNGGELVSVPHEKQGFPDLNRDEKRLKRLGCLERYGWIWVWAFSEETPDVDGMLNGLAGDFDWFGASNLHLLHTDEQVRSVNWKFLLEGGLESYHFRVAHRHSIGPHFHDNLSSYSEFGPHLRSILARTSLTELADKPVETWQLRAHAQVLYTIFPTSQFLVQPDHVAWIHLEPLTASSTRVRLSTLVPNDRIEDKADLAHWAKNHAITAATLKEDYELGESIQSGLESGANEHLTFGRFEGALASFNQSIRRQL